MPKTLLILRHAKAEEKTPQMKDYDRALAERGLNDAPAMGNLLKKSHLTPDFILSSAAKRAYQTAELAAEASGYKGILKTDIALYGAPPTDIIASIIKHVPPTSKRLLLVGHNPDLLLLIEMLTEQYLELPTAGLVEISLDIDQWSQLPQNKKAAIVNEWRPKELD